MAEPVLPGSVDPEQSTVVSAGQSMLGGVLSTTVMVWSQEATLPHSSVAVQVSVMTPALPQVGASWSEKSIETSPQSSAPVAQPVVSGSTAPVHSTVVSTGQLMLGGVSSTSVIN